MSNQWPGGFIKKNAPSVSLSGATGIWTLSQQAGYQKQGIWPAVINYPPILVNLNYSGTSSNAGVPTNTGTIQSYTIATKGTYHFQLIGAAGGISNGSGYASSGRSIDIYVPLNIGEIIWILAGNRGGCSSDSGWGGGGGGGAFIAVGSSYSTATCLAAAGGGGGSHASSTNSTTDGQAVTSNGAGGTTTITQSNRYGSGGTNGNGGNGNAGPGASGSGASGCGGGFLTGGSGASFVSHGNSFISGGAGGYDGTASRGSGAFGGGGAPDNNGGGGGGGYSGGGNGWNFCTGGGGGSFVISTWNSIPVTYTDNGTAIYNNGSGRVYIF